VQQGKLGALGSAAQGRVIRHGEIETEQAQNGADRAFGLTQRHTKHRAQGQRRQDRQGRVVWLPTPCDAGLSPPSRNRLIGEPHCQAAALAQGSIVVRPVCHSLPLPRDMVPAGGIGFEWHGGDPGVRKRREGSPNTTQLPAPTGGSMHQGRKQGLLAALRLIAKLASEPDLCNLSDRGGAP